MSKFLPFQKTLILICFFVLGTGSLSAQSYQAYNDLAKEAYDKKDYNLCVEYCSKSISISPNGWAYWERAIAYYGLYKYSEAADDYGKAIPYYSDYSSLGKLYCYIGDCNYYDFKYKLAIENYNKAATYGYSEYKYFYRTRGNALYFNGEYQKAISDFENAIPYYNDNPKDKAKLYRFIADAKYSLKNTDGALEFYTKAIDTDPGDNSSYEKRADVWADKKEYAKAKADIGKALLYSSSGTLGNFFDYKLYQDRSLYNYYLGEYEEGIKDAIAALKTDSTMTTYWRLGLNYKGAGKFNQSIPAYRNAIVKTKDSLNKAILYRNISLVYRGLLDYRSALKELNTAIALRKNYKEAYWTRAEIYTAIKQFPAALNDYDKCLTFYTDKSSLMTLYKERAELEYIMKDYDRALYDYNKLLELSPDNSNYLYNTGRFLIQSKKDPALGKERLEKAAVADLKIDTCSDYSFSKLFLGDVTAAINNSFRQIDKYRQDAYQYKWQLHILCCIYALSGNTTKALEYMEKSMAAGFDDFEHLYTDRDLQSIMNLPQYKAILVKYKAPVAKL